MSPRARVVGFSITMAFILLYAYVLGMFDGYFQQVLVHPRFRILAILAILGLLTHVSLEVMSRLDIIRSGIVKILHRILFSLLILLSAYFLAG
jgi:hypothetical protein